MMPVFASFASPLRHPTCRKSLLRFTFASFASFSPPPARMRECLHMRDTCTLLSHMREIYTQMTKMKQRGIQSIDSIGKSFCVTRLWVTKMTQTENNKGVNQ